MAYLDSIMPGSRVQQVSAMGAAVKEYNDRDARIAELEAELEEIRKQKKSLDVESDMGKYKFQYEADPSTYVGVQQVRRNAEETRKIREANDKATARSQDQSALKELGTGMFTAYYAIQAAENNLKQAIESGDPVAIRNAKTTLSQERALYKKNKDQYDMLAAKVMKDLGVEAPASGEEVKLDLDSDVDVKAAQEYQDLKGGIMTAAEDLRKRPDNMSDPEKADIIKNAKKALDEFRQRALQLGNLNSTLKAELEKTINAYEDAIPTFKKNQGTKMTAEKFAALSAKELKALGNKALRNYRSKGFKNKNLDWAINATAGK